MPTFYTRWQETLIQEAMKTRRVLLLSGSRQCGKTTLAKQINPKNSTYLTLDDTTLKQLAQQDPQGFVKLTSKMVIIDEIQRVPELLSAIKLNVDKNTAAGQYLLTGSANISSLPNVQESLAGRIQKIRLRPLAQGEILKTKPTFLEHAFQHSFPSSKKHYDRSALLEIAFRGGFPEALLLQTKERATWHRDYITALLERDLMDITHITRHHAMKELIHTLAA